MATSTDFLAFRDAAFLSEIQAAYTGRYRLTDALWWMEHPMETAPSGVPSPAKALVELQRNIYSSEGDGLGDEDATQQLRRAEQEVAAETQAILRAVEVARTKASATPPHHLRADDALIVDDSDAPEAEDATSARARWNWNGKLLAALGVTAALIIGLLLGTQLNLGGPSSTSRGIAAPGSPASDISQVLAVFDSVQNLNDLPAQTIPPNLIQESFRALYPESRADGLAGIYAAKSTSGMICMVLSFSEQDYALTCTTESEFPPAGLRLQWLEYSVSQSPDGSINSTPMDTSAVWKPDGSFDSSGGGRLSQG